MCVSVCLCLIAVGAPRPPTALLTSPQAPPSANQSSSSQAIRASGMAGKYGQGGMEGEKHQDIIEVYRSGLRGWGRGEEGGVPREKII